MRVLIAVTHLLGSGHLARARTLAMAFAEAGHDAMLVSGGVPVGHLAPPPGVRVVQLPPVGSDGADFTRLLAPEGDPVSAERLAARAAMLTAAVADFRPAVVITELYPFGRRTLRAEFDALLDAAAALTPRPRILASVRDILAPPSKPARAAETEAVLARHYDAVLVHSDPADIPLDASWPVTPWLAARLRYTGYIAPPPPGPVAGDPDTVIVSAGGADVGAALFETALAASVAGRRWHLLVGGLAAALPGTPRVVIEPVRPDFRSLLAAAGASVSLCGYNTALDLLATGTPGVFVPFDAGRETEQRIRAERLARRPHFAKVPAADLTPAALLAALDRVTAAGRFAPDPGRLAGARASVVIAERLMAESLTDAR